MNRLYTISYFSMYLLYCYLILSSLIYCIDGASIPLRNNEALDKFSKDDDETPDMSVVESEETAEPSRNDLIKIIQKSQFFRDIFLEQPDPMNIQFGHVCENPNEWEQRFEKRDFIKNHHQGKMRWGNKNGDYGEHYWDLGHAG